MARITAPVDGFTGHVGEVEFTDGVAESNDPHHLNYFRRHGYQVGDVVEELQSEPDPGEAPEEETDEDPAEELDEESEDDEPVAVRPAVNAPKADWVAYAVAALGLNADEADAESKQALIDRANQQ